jgi:PKD repeat protein
MGGDQWTPGPANGALTMAIEAEYTSVAPGFAVRFTAQNKGAILASVWDFGDGTFVTNQAIAAHAWSVAGNYTVRLTGYNDSFPDGVTASIQVEVTDNVYYVNQANPTPVSPYTSWETAATNIQDAIEIRTAGGLVLVTNGVYASGSVVAKGNNRIALSYPVEVRSVNGPEVTVIEGAEGVRCAYVGTSAKLSGFTLTRGEAYSGGGALCEDSATLTNCIVTGNSANADGGGVSHGTLYNCTLTGNSAGEGGGASGSTLYNCTVTGNSALGNPSYSGSGGGSYEGTLHNCILTSNSATSGGGASGSTLYNCTVTHNWAEYGGGGTYESILYNCTLTGNSAGRSGGGASGGTLYNCIVYFNTACSGANFAAHSRYEYDQGVYTFFPVTFYYSCTFPLPSGGTNNIVADPQLASLTHLSMSSPCIGAASGAYATGVDIDGEPWADPPCMGADQLTPGQATGGLSEAIEAEYTNVATGFAINFAARIQGASLASVWDFGDGTLITNQPVTSHAWNVPGSYTVQLTGYNDSFPNGVTTNLTIEVVERPIYYVNQANPTPVSPYTRWETAATNIQDAIESGTTVGRLVLVTNGVYASGSAVAEGTNRIALTDPVEVRSVNGPEMTVIEGAEYLRCVYVGSHATLSGFTMTNGYHGVPYYAAGFAGGAWCERSAILTNCVVRGNSAYLGGGSYGGTLNNCVLTGNSAEYGGGSSDGTLYNCIITGNSASYGGGGVYECTLYNCTVTHNYSEYGAGGAYGGALYNCVVYFNYWENYGGGTLINHSCTTPLPADGTSNTTNAPVFVDPAGGNYHLQFGSPGIDAGTDLSAIITTDLDGNPRPLDGDGDGIAAFDMGAYELRVLYVSTNSLTAISPYTNWTTAAHSIQDAVDAAQPGDDVVLVTNGVYVTGERDVFGEMTRVSIDKAITAKSVNGPEVTVIEGALGIRCAYVGTNAILSGFTLTKGNAVMGGGARSEDSATLTNCVITSNSASDGGGGVYGGTLYNCNLTSNSTIIGNSFGGGSAGATLHNCTLAGNSARYVGGGSAGGTLYNCTLTGNSADYAGGSAASMLYNCTLTGNSATYGGGGVGGGTLNNCIVYFNSASSDDNYFGSFPFSPVSFNYSCTTPLPADGTGNITNAPLFMDTNGWSDLHLRYGSPGIDAGTNLSAILTTDLDGNPRPLDGDGDGIAAFDMGAYEFDVRSLIPPDWFSNHGLDPADPHVVSGNPDHDPYTTFQEWLADTDPTNAFSYFHIEGISKHSPATVSFQSSTNRTYTLWRANQLGPPAWTVVPGQENIPGTDNTLTLGDDEEVPQQFYRVQINLP